MRNFAYFIAALFLLLLAAIGLWQIGKSRSFQFFGEIVPRVETSQKIIALTFDDGPAPKFTDEILEILREEDIKATFFLIGGELEKHPDEGKKIAAAGHEIGNHTFSHVRMIFVTPAFVKEEIEKTDELIRAAGYQPTANFRPPYGKKLFALPFYLSQNNRKTIIWDVEPESFPDVAKSTEEITRYVLDKTQNGSIILLHVMYDPKKISLNAVKPIIKGLKQKGFRFVTVSELVSNSRFRIQFSFIS